MISDESIDKELATLTAQLDALLDEIGNRRRHDSLDDEERSLYAVAMHIGCARHGLTAARQCVYEAIVRRRERRGGR